MPSFGFIPFVKWSTLSCFYIYPVVYLHKLIEDSEIVFVCTSHHMHDCKEFCVNSYERPMEPTPKSAPLHLFKRPEVTAAYTLTFVKGTSAL